eukprot:s1126_g4.t5
MCTKSEWTGQEDLHSRSNDAPSSAVPHTTQMMAEVSSGCAVDEAPRVWAAKRGAFGAHPSPVALGAPCPMAGCHPRGAQHSAANRAVRCPRRDGKAWRSSGWRKITLGSRCQRVKDVIAWVAAWAYLRRQLGGLRGLGGLQPDAAMLNVLLSSSTESKGWRQGLQLLQIFLEKGIGLTVRTAMKVIPLVSWSTARELLFQMSRQVEMNVVVCNAALAAGVLDPKHFHYWKVEPDLISFNTASDLLVKAGRWRQAQQTLQCLEDVGIERDTLSLNIQLSACPWSAAAAIAAAQGTGLQLDLVSFSSTMAACERFSAWLPALQIFQAQRHHGIAPDLIAYNSLTSACCKGESWSSGLHFFSDILMAGNGGSVEIAGTAVLAACKRNEEWPWCLELLQVLQVRRAADVAAFTATILACGKGSRTSECQMLLDQLKEMAPPPLAAVNVQMMLHQVAGRWRDALQLLVSCAQRALRCDEATLLGATTAAGRRWRRAVLLMKTLELREMKPDVAVCSTLIAAAPNDCKYLGYLAPDKMPDKETGEGVKLEQYLVLGPVSGIQKYEFEKQCKVYSVAAGFREWQRDVLNLVPRKDVHVGVVSAGTAARLGGRILSEGLVQLAAALTRDGRVLLVCNEEDEKVIGGKLEDVMEAQNWKEMEESGDLPPDPEKDEMAQVLQQGKLRLVRVQRDECGLTIGVCAGTYKPKAVKKVSAAKKTKATTGPRRGQRLSMTISGQRMYLGHATVARRAVSAVERRFRSVQATWPFSASGSVGLGKKIPSGSGLDPRLGSHMDFEQKPMFDDHLLVEKYAGGIYDFSLKDHLAPLTCLHLAVPHWFKTYRKRSADLLALELRASSVERTKTMAFFWSQSPEATVADLPDPGAEE